MRKGDERWKREERLGLAEAVNGPGNKARALTFVTACCREFIIPRTEKGGPRVSHVRFNAITAFPVAPRRVKGPTKTKFFLRFRVAASSPPRDSSRLRGLDRRRINQRSSEQTNRKSRRGDLERSNCYESNFALNF